MERNEAPVVIDVRDVKKKFRVYKDKGNTLKERLLFSERRKKEEHWVLKDISFHAVYDRNGSTGLRQTDRLARHDILGKFKIHVEMPLEQGESLVLPPHQPQFQTLLMLRIHIQPDQIRTAADVQRIQIVFRSIKVS